MLVKKTAVLHAAIMDIGEALSTLGNILNQGVREDNQMQLGNVAVALRKAAWRVEHGDLVGWADHELERVAHF